MLLLCNFGDREYLDLLGTQLEPGRREVGAGGLVHRGLRHRRAAPARSSSGASRCARCSGWPASGSYAAEGSGEIGLAFSTAAASTLSNDELDPYFAAAYEAAHEAVYNCLVAARPAELRDGTMQDAFPIELVRELARARDGDG